MAGAELRVLVPSDGSALEKETRTLLTTVPDIVWSRSEDCAILQARFSFEIGETLNELLRQLVDAGVGIHARSSISVWPSSLLLRGTRSRNGSGAGNEASSSSNSRRSSSNSGGGGGHIASANEHAFTTADVQASGARVEISCDPDGVEVGGLDQRDPPGGWYDFLGTAAERLAMARAVHAAEADARLSFDFLCLLFIAAFLAALGLVENSTEILVASMLISPLMGPIMAFTLGTLARERRLQRRGVRVEFLGLLGCLVMGFCFGLCACGVAGGVPALWPTREMSSRGQLHAVWVGVLVALLSGVAVALATLGGYTASLVGVAISSAVLPPAVNAGLLWSLACITLIPAHFDDESSDSASNSVSSVNEFVASPRPQPADLALQGALSVCLTVLNIICIFLAAVLVLKIKHVTPWTEKRELRSDVLRWVAEERASASPANFWVPARATTLGRRNSLLIPRSVTATELLTVYSSSTRTWSPGVCVSHPSLKELWGTHHWPQRNHGTASVVSAPNATAQPLVPLIQSTEHQLAPLVPSHQIFSTSESRRLVSSAITLPPIREVGRSPSPPLHSHSASPPPSLPRFVVTRALHDPLLDPIPHT